MAKSKSQSVVVSQIFNQRKREATFEARTAEAKSIAAAMDEFTYKVEKAVNTLDVAVAQELTKAEVQKLIDRDMTVTIQPVK